MLAKMRSVSLGAIPGLPLHAMGLRRNTATSIQSHHDHDVEIAYEEDMRQKELLAKFDSKELPQYRSSQMLTLWLDSGGYISFPEFEEYEDSDHQEHDEEDHPHHMAPHSNSISKQRRQS
jgi:hypothetical protein